VGSLRDDLATAGRVVLLDGVRKGATFYVVRVSGSTVTISHSGTFDEDAARLPDVNKGSYSGPLPTGTYHGARHSTDIYPNSLGLDGKRDRTGAPVSWFCVLNSLEPLPGSDITYIDERPGTERERHPLSA
jgi:hypothetical protein